MPGIPGTNPHEVPLKAGEFVLGYEDETYNIPPIPQPEVLGRSWNLRSLPQATHARSRFRQYCQRARDRAEEEWLAAQDCRSLAQWRAAGTGSGQGQS